MSNILFVCPNCGNARTKEEIGNDKFCKLCGTIMVEKKAVSESEEEKVSKPTVVEVPVSINEEMLKEVKTLESKNEALLKEKEMLEEQVASLTEENEALKKQIEEMQDSPGEVNGEENVSSYENITTEGNINLALS